MVEYSSEVLARPHGRPVANALCIEYQIGTSLSFSFLHEGDSAVEDFGGPAGCSRNES